MFVLKLSGIQNKYLQLTSLMNINTILFDKEDI